LVSIQGAHHPTRVTTTDTSGTGYGVLPNRICDATEVPGGHTRFQWFNLGCFTQPAFGTWGNSNLGVVTQPGINNCKWRRANQRWGRTLIRWRR
jgi:hypothetical protein